MLFVQIGSRDMNKIFEARHHNIEHDFRRKKKSKTSFIIFRAKTNFLRLNQVLGFLIVFTPKFYKLTWRGKNQLMMSKHGNHICKPATG